MQYSIIVATDVQCGIAKDGNIPWNCPADMQHFKKTTLGHIVIMGRKTQETLKAPLKDRINIVLSAGVVLECNLIDNTDYKSIYSDGWLFCDSLDTVDKVCETIGKNKKCFVIGGAEIYNQYLKRNNTEEIIWTKLSKNYGCDKFFHATIEYGPYGYNHTIQPGLILDRFMHIKNLDSIGIPGLIEVWRKNG